MLERTYYSFFAFILTFLNLVRIDVAFGQTSAQSDSIVINFTEDSTQIAADSLKIESQQDTVAVLLPVVKKRYSISKWEVERKELNGQMLQDMTDVIQMIPSVSTLNLGNPGQENLLIFKGGKPSQARVYLDDLLIEDVITGSINSTALPFHVTDTLKFRQVAGALQPSLQLQTKKVNSRLPFSTVRYNSGDWNYTDLNLIFALPLSAKNKLVVAGGRQKFGGFYGQNRDVGNSRLFGKFQRILKPGLVLNFIGLINKNKANLPGTVPPDFIQNVVSPKLKQERLNTQIGLNYKNEIDSYRLNTKVAFSKTRRESFDSDTTLFNNNSRIVRVEVENVYRKTKVEYKAGAGLKLVKLESNRIDDLNEGTKFGYLNANINLSEKLNLDLQIQLEKQKAFNAQLNAESLLTYQYMNKTQFWVSVRKYTNYPSFVERFWPLDFYKGNENLLAEQIHSVQFGIKSDIKKTLTLESEAYFKSIHNWIENTFVDSQFTFSFYNINNYNIGGLDLKANWKYFKSGLFGITASLHNFSASNPIVPSTPDVVVHSFLEAGTSMFENYVFSVLRFNAHFYGARSAWRYSGFASPAITSLPAATILDTQVKLIFASAAITVTYKNLTNQVYELVPGFFMPPRSLAFGIEWQFWD